MTSKASGDFSVTISTRASWSMVHERSTSLPSTLPTSAALARPAPMDAATSRTLGGASKDLVLLSGSVMVIMAIGGGNQESASGPRDLGRGTGDRGPGTKSVTTRCRHSEAGAKRRNPGSMLILNEMDSGRRGNDRHKKRAPRALAFLRDAF